MCSLLLPSRCKHAVQKLHAPQRDVQSIKPVPVCYSFVYHLCHLDPASPMQKYFFKDSVHSHFRATVPQLFQGPVRWLLVSRWMYFSSEGSGLPDARRDTAGIPTRSSIKRVRPVTNLHQFLDHVNFPNLTIPRGKLNLLVLSSRDKGDDF